MTCATPFAHLRVNQHRESVFFHCPLRSGSANRPGISPLSNVARWRRGSSRRSRKIIKRHPLSKATSSGELTVAFA
jgi:hypothetical protein